MTDTVLNLNLSNRYEIQKRKRDICELARNSQLLQFITNFKLIIRKTWMSNEIPLAAPLLFSPVVAWLTGQDAFPLAKTYICVIRLCASANEFSTSAPISFLFTQFRRSCTIAATKLSRLARRHPRSEQCPNVFTVMFTLTIIFGQCLSQLLAPRQSIQKFGILLLHDFTFSLKN